MIQLKDSFKILLMAVVYFIIAYFGLKLAFSNQQVTPTWPASGFAVFCYLIYREKSLPAIYLGALSINIFVSSKILSSLFIAFGNTLEAMLTVLIFKSLFKEDNFFNKNGAIKLFFAASFGCLIASIGGALSLHYLEDVPAKQFLNIFWTWWLGDLTGIVVITPFLLYFFYRKFDNIFKAPVEFMAFLFIFNLYCFLILGSDILAEYKLGALSYTMLPLVIWGVYRFEIAGSLTIVIFSYAYSVVATIMSTGPFYIKHDINGSLLNLDLFIITIAVSTLTMALLYYNLHDKKLSTETNG
ncbi:MAG: hypothetical protein GY909_08850 [Oligoflexia bacterium]|nr:hypothetical protein [Oligoflexia bacterium]